MYHKSVFGSYAPEGHADKQGYVPEATDGPWDLDYDHSEATHDEDGNLTDAGVWWEEDGWPEIKAAAIAATAEAEEAIAAWRKKS